jgi:hypothetical protein
MKRTVRGLIGAGTFATALIAMTAAHASAQTTDCIGEVPTVCGHVFTDTGTADHTFQVGEGTPDITVVVTDSTGQLVASATPSNPTSSSACAVLDSLDCGYYSFDIPDTGDYLICIVVPPQTTNCADAAMHPETQHVAGGTQGQHEDFEVPSNQPPSDVWGVGTGTPGYWKNHPEAWPLPVSIGGVTYGLNAAVHPNLYDAIKLMGKVSGDKTYSMFAQLISAKLNAMLNNNTVCIADTITQADAWMTAHPVGSNVKASSTAWIEADAWHQALDDYNNGKMCAPHRD